MNKQQFLEYKIRDLKKRKSELLDKNSMYAMQMAIEELEEVRDFKENVENRGDKKYCGVCKRRIERVEEYFRLKSVQPLSMKEKIVRLYCLKCAKLFLKSKEAGA